MPTPEWLAERFEEHRAHLRAVAYRMLASASEAEDASFSMTFDEIAPIVERSPAAARQLASRARRRVQSDAPSADRDLRRQRSVVDEFLAAVRDGDFERLVAVLDPDVVLRADGGALAGASRGCATLRRSPSNRARWAQEEIMTMRLAVFTVFVDDQDRSVILT